MNSATVGGGDTRGPAYTVLFAVVLSLVSATIVASAYVLLRDRQRRNEQFALQVSVLHAAGLIAAGETVTEQAVRDHFARIRAVVVDVRTGVEVAGDEAVGGLRASPDRPDRHGVDSAARESALSHQAVVYKVIDVEGRMEAIVLPVDGKGLWSTLFGFLALESDLKTIRGLTFYQHGETPGLGGEIDNPRWQALWPGRRAFDDDDRPAVQVIRGRAGPPSQDPFRVDGLSGATLTGRGVTNLLRAWLGPEGFGPYLETLRTAGGSSVEHPAADEEGAP